MWKTSQRDTARESVNARRSMILDEVNHRSSIQVSDICERFHVSEVTARSDLDKLEHAGKLRRTHGGAVSIDRTITISYPDQRMNINVAAKQAIAKLAAPLIHDGDTVLIDTGTTAFELVRILGEKHDLTLVTSDLSIATFADSYLPHADVVLLGGLLRKNHRYMTGSITSSVLERLQATIAFLATDAFDTNHGFTTEYLGNAEIKSLMITHANKRVMLMDSSKLREPRFAKFATLSDFEVLVCEKDPQELLKTAIAQSGLTTELIVQS